VRPDLRPVMGVLLAVHAFVPVAALHEGLARAGHPVAATPRFAERRAQVLAGNARGLAIVQRKGAPTEAGRRILDDLARAHAALLEAGATLPRAPTDTLPPG
jgi:HEXXH motif-containing protein